MDAFSRDIDNDLSAGQPSISEGRVADPASNETLVGEYVVGWAKRAPTGLIGTNRADSALAVNAMIADLIANLGIQANNEGSLNAIPQSLNQRGAP